MSLREDLDEILFGDPFLDHLVDNSILDTIHPFLFEFCDLSLYPLVLSVSRSWPWLRQFIVELK